MEKVINSYESLFIVDASLSEEAIKATVSKFTTMIGENAEIVEVAEWGRRRLAYPINKQNEGYYVVVTYKCAGGFSNEFERICNIDEAIVRSMTVKLEYDAAAKKVAAPVAAAPVVEAPVTEAPAAETAPVAEAAPEQTADAQ